MLLIDSGEIFCSSCTGVDNVVVVIVVVVVVAWLDG